jgi:hypothetical protein
MAITDTRCQHETLLQYLNNYLDFCLDADAPSSIVSTTDTGDLLALPTCKTSLLELKRGSESNSPYLLAHPDGYQGMGC